MLGSVVPTSPLLVARRALPTGPIPPSTPSASGPVGSGATVDNSLDLPTASSSRRRKRAATHGRPNTASRHALRRCGIGQDGLSAARPRAEGRHGGTPQPRHQRQADRTPALGGHRDTSPSPTSRVRTSRADGATGECNERWTPQGRGRRPCGGAPTHPRIRGGAGEPAAPRCEGAAISAQTAVTFVCCLCIS